MNKKIVLNCLPPSPINIPSPALSILKSWLVINQYSVSVIYWNIELYALRNDFLFNNSKNINQYEMSLFLNYIAFENKDSKIYDYVKNILQSSRPLHLVTNPGFYESHMKLFYHKTEEAIMKVLSSIEIDEVLYFGFSLKMDQWIFTSILAKKIKEIDSSIPIIIGGIANDFIARSFLDNFKEFDYAIWGEGEMPLLELTNKIKEKNTDDLHSVGNLAFRENSNIILSSKKNKSFIDLSNVELYPNYEDYFAQLEKYKYVHELVIPIEGSRGCHWNKCNFCYLNIGYNYRKKTVSKICYEINYMINKYGVFKFEFLDNDIVGKDIEMFNYILDEFIKIKNENADFQILIAEVITKGLNFDIIKKMSLAGFYFAQIGYESPSSHLLNKINKKNTFASNLLYIKSAVYNGIKINGVNVIVNLLEETEADIIEACDNLRFLRFFLNPSIFYHNLIPLSVNSSSMYYRKIISNKSTWELYNLNHLILKEYVRPDLHWDIMEYIKPNRHFLWDHFVEIERSYLNNRYSYKINKKNSILIYNVSHQ